MSSSCAAAYWIAEMHAVLVRSCFGEFSATSVKLTPNSAMTFDNSSISCFVAESETDSS